MGKKLIVILQILSMKKD